MFCYWLSFAVWSSWIRSSMSTAWMNWQRSYPWSMFMSLSALCSKSNWPLDGSIESQRRLPLSSCVFIHQILCFLRVMTLECYSISDLMRSGLKHAKKGNSPSTVISHTRVCNWNTFVHIWEICGCSTQITLNDKRLCGVCVCVEWSRSADNRSSSSQNHERQQKNLRGISPL